MALRAAKAPPGLKCGAVHIVQPGIAKSQLTLGQLELLAFTEHYLMETLNVPFGVVTSA